jgi:AraC family transcriptional regulator
MRDGIRRSVNIIRARYEEPLSLDDMARHAMISKFHFLRTFRRVTGVTPGRFLSAVRIHEAKHLLLTTSLSVAEISARVGYGSLGTFTRRFTECVGMSPTAYRTLTCAERVPDAGANSAPAGAAGLSGLIRTDRPSVSPIFVGLFDSPVPLGRPVVCGIFTQDGSWRLDDVPPGHWYLLAAAIDAAPADPDTPLLTGVSDEIRVRPGHHQNVEITIRPADWRLPPLLSVLPGIERDRLLASAC